MLLDSVTGETWTMGFLPWAGIPWHGGNGWPLHCTVSSQASLLLGTAHHCTEHCTLHTTQCTVLTFFKGTAHHCTTHCDVHILTSHCTSPHWPVLLSVHTPWAVHITVLLSVNTPWVLKGTLDCTALHCTALHCTALLPVPWPPIQFLPQPYLCLHPSNTTAATVSSCCSLQLCRSWSSARLVFSSGRGLSSAKSIFSSCQCAQC